VLLALRGQKARYIIKILKILFIHKEHTHYYVYLRKEVQTLFFISKKIYLEGEHFLLRATQRVNEINFQTNLHNLM